LKQLTKEEEEEEEETATKGKGLLLCLSGEIFIVLYFKERL
jgi:hypothetical protein